MREFFHYFFGAGEEVEFVNFSLAHFLPILMAIGIIYLTWRYRDKLGAYKNEKNVRLALALICIITEMSYFWRLVGVPDLNPNPHEHLPITVCGWCIIFCSYLAVTKNQTLFDISYFWLFSGTIFALLTPTVITYTGPTRFRYYQFWLEHTMGYITLFYMIFVHKMRPTLKSMIKAFCSLGVLTVIAVFANTILGTGANYLFMAEGEDPNSKSLVNMLPQNLWLRALLMGAVVSVLFLLSYLPWYLKDRKAKKALQAAEAPAGVEVPAPAENSEATDAAAEAMMQEAHLQKEEHTLPSHGSRRLRRPFND